MGSSSWHDHHTVIKEPLFLCVASMLKMASWSKMATEPAAIISASQTGSRHRGKGAKKKEPTS